ncbi:DUF4145 domain-containing protein [Pseudomonas cedrina]|uniref:DUF4145 domain-containing protein n=1 Tax=Pseudomonas cedrina TaxID=651740 RepID=UPI003ED93156
MQTKRLVVVVLAGEDRLSLMEGKKMTALFGKRFGELEQQLTELQKSAVMRRNGFTDKMEQYLSWDVVLNWGVKARSLIERTCGENSSQLQMFNKSEEQRSYDSNLDRLSRMGAVFLATKEDFEGGYLNSLRNLVQAEVFNNELEQAEELFDRGYATAAAVIAGVVLETSLRDLCAINGIEHGSMNKMNDDLAKAGAYNANQKKQIASLSAIRNSAAHGKPEEFTKDQVRGMIDDVQRFLVANF